MFKADAVAIVSALFSMISIMVTALTVITQIMIMKKQSFTVIQFAVNGMGLKKTMTRKVKGIAAGIAVILGVPQDAVEIERSQDLSAGGFGFVINVDVNVDDNIDYQQLMQKAIDRGALAELFRKNWKLQNIPVITSLDCKMMSTSSELQMIPIAESANMMIHNSIHKKMSTDSFSNENS